MAETNKTITDIIAERRRQAEEIERVCADEIKRGVLVCEHFAADVRDLVADIRQEADRLEAALKREKAAIEADALAVGGLVEASRATVENSSAVGDASKLREALKATLDLFWDIHNANRSPQSNQAYAVIRKIKAALAAPRKNCERFQTWDEAKDAYWREQGDPCDWRKLGAWLFALEKTAQGSEVRG